MKKKQKHGLTQQTCIWSLSRQARPAAAGAWSIVPEFWRHLVLVVLFIKKHSICQFLFLCICQLLDLHSYLHLYLFVYLSPGRSPCHRCTPSHPQGRIQRKELFLNNVKNYVIIFGNDYKNNKCQVGKYLFICIEIFFLL